jgi:hypothetical protein
MPWLTGFPDAEAWAEFETVLGLLDGTQQGQGRVLLVEGEPGSEIAAAGSGGEAIPAAYHLLQGPVPVTLRR